MSLQRKTRLAPAVCLLLTAFCAAQAADDVFLPAQLGSWQQVAWARENAQELERLVGHQAALLREYGSLLAEQGVYRRDNDEARVTVHQMQDRSSAYGAFSLLRAGSHPIALGEAGARQDNRLVFYQGNFFVYAEGPLDLADLRPLADRLEVLSQGQPSLPTLPAYLPRQGLLPGSDRYLLGPLALARVVPLVPGDWVGFAYAAEVVAARYRIDNSQATLLLISYPTPQIAAARLRDFQQLFNLNGTGDPRRPLVYAKRSGTMVVFVAGIETGRAAATLLNRVRYEAELSWSEPAEPRSVPNWPKTLLNIFVGTGLLVLFAFLSGVVFGIVRLIVKRLFPGAIFDRPEDIEIIRLDLEVPRRR